MAHQPDPRPYDDAIVRLFVWATLFWGLAGMLIGAALALQLVAPALNLASEHASFGRLRPVHTNAVLYAFIGNAVFAGVYFATQRLCDTRLASDLLSRLHFWSWQALIAATLLTLPLGLTQARDRAEAEWPIDIAFSVVWIALFGVNFFRTLAARRRRTLPIPLWFFIATIVGVAFAHLLNSLALPMGPMKSLPVFAGTQDALLAAWHRHMLDIFLILMPFLGLMYFFLPQAAARPIYSPPLAVAQFWVTVAAAGWAGAASLQLTPIPDSIGTIALVASLVLGVGLSGGMANGLLTLRGLWRRALREPALGFFAAALLFFGLFILGNALLAFRPVAALARFTDAPVALAHAGGLGWSGLMIFGMFYRLAPPLFRRPLWSDRLARAHLFLAVAGTLIYILAILVAAVMQSRMWLDFDAAGSLAVPMFIDTVTPLRPWYWLRALGGLLYLAGALACLLNLLMTATDRPADQEFAIPPLIGTTAAIPAHDGPQTNTLHERLVQSPIRLALCVLAALAIGPVVQAFPVFRPPSPNPPVAIVKPYTPLELAGRDLYLANGCVNCHSQMIRPVFPETQRYSDFSRGGESAHDHPAQWGTRRIGPDLARAGLLRPTAEWHFRHFLNPPAVTEGSVMPAMPWLFENTIDFGRIRTLVEAMAALGVPYEGGMTSGRAAELARAQAREIAASIEFAGGPPAAQTADKQVIALIAYIQRLGTDLDTTTTRVQGGDRP